MIIRIRSGGAATLALATVLAAPFAVSADDIENLVVTANRTPMPPAKVGSSVSTVDRQIIERRQSVFATDILRDVPGLAVNRTGSFGSQTQVRIRGAEANQVLVMIDGVEANDPAANDEFDFASLTTYDVESIEIVRGPQSALWGSDAAAGVINVTTRRGREPIGGDLFLEGGSFDTVYGGGRFSANGDDTSATVTASWFDTEGESAAADGDEDDGYENLTVGMTARWEPTANSGLGIFARYTDSTTEFDDFDFTTGLPADADRESEDTLTLIQGSSRLSFLGDRWLHSLRLTYLESDRDQLNLGTKESSTAADKIGVYYQTSYRLSQDAGAAGQRVVLAIDHEQTDYEQRGSASPFGDPNQDQDIDNTGYILEYIAEPFGLFDLSAGIRYDDNSDFDDVTTYRLTSAYRVGHTDSRLHASVGTGQKAPTFTERFGFFADQFTGNPNLQPEETTGYDVGIDQGFLDGRARVDLTYFNEKLENEIDGFVFDPAIGGFTASNLDGTSRRKGVEIDFRSRIADGVDASATYTYTDSEQPDPVTGRAREIRRPRHVASLNLNYAFPGDHANLNLNVSHTGEQTDRIFPAPTFAGQTIVLDEYTLVNLTGSYRFTQALTGYARIENLFDKDYTDVAGFQAPGIGAYAGFRMAFGR